MKYFPLKTETCALKGYSCKINLNKQVQITTLLEIRVHNKPSPTLRIRSLPEIEDRRRFDLQAQFLNALFTSIG